MTKKTIADYMIHVGNLLADAEKAIDAPSRLEGGESDDPKGDAKHYLNNARQILSSVVTLLRVEVEI